MPIQICPDRGQFQALFAGTLTPQAAEEMASHVETCPQCAQTVSELGSDTLADALRSGAAEPDTAHDLRVRAIIDQHRTHLSAAPSATITRSVEESQLPGARTANESDEEEPIDFLSPAIRAGEIGRLGGYGILRVLGRGGMGLVFEAVDLELDRKVALKVMKRSIARKAENRERFLREARTAAKVESDYICPVYSISEENGIPFIAMPFLKGEPLDARLRRESPLPIAEAVRVGREIAEGLAAAHAAGLVHRDIKPGNIWLEATPGRPEVRAKILDFGLARPTQDHINLTQSGAIMGTPAYMAPEQARAQTVDHRADLFSLGVLLYEMTTGRRPFSGPDTMAILTSLALDTPAPPHDVNPQIPRPVSDLIVKLLAKTPAERVQSADEVVKVLEAQEYEYCPALIAARTEVAVAPSARPVAARGKSLRVGAIAALALVLVGAAVLATYQIVFKTENGTLIVEVDDDARVTFSKGKLEVQSEDGKTKYIIEPSPKNMGLPPGKYLVRVTGVDGLKLDTDKFEMTRAGYKVRVAMDQTALSKREPVTSDPDRRAAEWVLSVGGVVGVNDQDQQLKAIAELPKGPVRLTYVDLNAVKQVSDEGLANFKDCKNLTHLILGNTQVSDAGLAHFKDCKNLVTLSIHDTRVGDAGLANFKDCKSLTNVGLHNSQVGNAGLAHVRDCKSLNYLNLRATKVGDAGLVHVKDCVNLSWLILKQTKVTAEGVERLSKALPRCKIESDHGTFGPGSADPDRRAAEWVLSVGGTIRTKENGQDRNISAANALPAGAFELSHVFLESNTRVDDAGLAVFKDCKRLTDLYLAQTRVSDAGLAHFKDCKNLTLLWLGSTQVSDSGLAHFKDCQNLTRLHLPHTPVSDAGLAHFKDCKNLTHLYLNGTQVSDAGLVHFKDCKNLTILELQRTQVSDTGLAHFKDCTNLTQLNLAITQVSDAGLGHFRNCKNLTHLSLSGTKTSDAGLSHFKDCKNLTNLDLALTQVSDAGLVHFKNLKDLTDLRLVGTKVGDAGLNELGNKAKLSSLDVKMTKVTADGVKKLSSALPQCTIESDHGTFGPNTDPDRRAAEWVLAVGGTVQINDRDTLIRNVADLPTEPFRLTAADHLQKVAVNDAGMANFKDCKHLTKINLSVTQVGDAGLAHLKDCTNLRHLALGNTQVYDEGLAVFKDCKDLVYLDLGNTKATDAGMVHFANCTKLTYLDLSYTKVTDAGLAHLKSCTGLGTIKLQGLNITDAGLIHFKDCRDLEHLSLHAAKRVSGVGLAHFKDCQKLTQIELHGTQVGDAGMAQFGNWPNLTLVDLSNTSVKDGLRHLKNCKNLTKLHLHDTNVTDAGLAFLQGHAKLSLLDLHNTKVTDDGLAFLKECPGLSSLDLRETAVSDVGMPHLAACKKLAMLYLRSTKVTDKGADNLKKALPNCRIIWNGGIHEPSRK